MPIVSLKIDGRLHFFFSALSPYVALIRKGTAEAKKAKENIEAAIEAERVAFRDEGSTGFWLFKAPVKPPVKPVATAAPATPPRVATAPAAPGGQVSPEIQGEDQAGNAPTNAPLVGGIGVAELVRGDDSLLANSVPLVSDEEDASAEAVPAAVGNRGGVVPPCSADAALEAGMSNAEYVAAWMAAPVSEQKRKLVELLGGEIEMAGLLRGDDNALGSTGSFDTWAGAHL